MTTAELHKILDDENRKLSLDELKQVIYGEMIGCARKSTCVEYNGVSINKVATSNEINPYWKGKEHAFQIVLDLLEHADDLIKPPCKFGDTVFFIYSANQIEPIAFIVANIQAKTIDGELCWFVFDENGYGGRFGDLCKKDWIWYIGKDKSAAERKLKEYKVNDNQRL